MVQSCINPRFDRILLLIFRRFFPYIPFFRRCSPSPWLHFASLFYFPKLFFLISYIAIKRAILPPSAIEKIILIRRRFQIILILLNLLFIFFSFIKWIYLFISTHYPFFFHISYYIYFLPFFLSFPRI